MKCGNSLRHNQANRMPTIWISDFVLSRVGTDTCHWEMKRDVEMKRVPYLSHVKTKKASCYISYSESPSNGEIPEVKNKNYDSGNNGTASHIKTINPN